MPVDYSKAKIYCIRSPNTDLIYIGSTCQQLSTRMTGHRADFKKETVISSKIIFEFGDAYIELLENYPCNNREELCKREGELIRTNNNCCNKQVAGRTIKEWYEENKKETLEKQKAYKEANIEAYKERQKEWYESNKERVKCECGADIIKHNMAGHIKTQKHQNYLKTLTEQNNLD